MTVFVGGGGVKRFEYFDVKDEEANLNYIKEKFELGSEYKRY